MNEFDLAERFAHRAAHHSEGRLCWAANAWCLHFPDGERAPDHDGLHMRLAMTVLREAAAETDDERERQRLCSRQTVDNVLYLARHMLSDF